MNPTLLSHLILQVATPDPPKTLNVILLPGMCALLGGLIFGAGYGGSVRARKSLLWRHAGTLLVMVAWFWSIQKLLTLWDPQIGVVYRAELYGNYTRASHYALPTLLLVALIAIGLAESRLNRILPPKGYSDDIRS